MLKTNLCLVLFLLYASTSIGQNVPPSSHVWILAEENHSYEEVVDNPRMPYYNSLIERYGLAEQFYSNRHGSLPALMYFAAGTEVTTDSNTTSCEHSDNNIVRQVLKRGYTWKSYQENLPYAGFQGLYGGEGDKYYRRHNPLIDFIDVCPNTGQAIKSVPYPEMESDFNDSRTVNFAWITPDVDSDAHNGTLQEADQWMQDNVPAILARPEFKSGGDGILFVVWDEAALTDDRCSDNVSKGCGGRTAVLVIGPQVKGGYRSKILYHNQNVLKTICKAMDLSTCPGEAESAAPMTDFFKE
jgi:acid phosphatase